MKLVNYIETEQAAIRDLLAYTHQFEKHHPGMHAQPKFRESALKIPEYLEGNFGAT